MTWVAWVAIAALVLPALVLVACALVAGSRADDALGYDDEVAA